MKNIRYYQVTGVQMFIMAMLVGIIASALIMINIAAKEYLQLPLVHQSADAQCAVVSNFKNGDAYNCADVDVVLRKYRIAKSQ